MDFVPITFVGSALGRDLLMTSMNSGNDVTPVSMFIWAPDKGFKTDLKNCKSIL